ncbi:TetR/AcrR family transcriptional regulator [Streptomyces sp. NPDC086077]|uniref:TetR/AcrR family transcriptional regulator n=1 Tax=Streptomyces sp. NPDC086077 TaxID=3154862 RepID=UPI00341F4054
MARNREFDVDTAVDRAMDLFWRRGYAATSLQDLLGEMSIGSGSLYAAFGSKEKLYARALERYCSVYTYGFAERLENATDVRTAVRSVLLEMVEADLAEPERGCLVVNAATERSDDPTTADRVAAALRLLESALAGALERAKTRGELSPDKDPAELARFLTTFVQGLRVVGKARLGRAFVEDAVSTALRALD